VAVKTDEAFSGCGLVRDLPVDRLRRRPCGLRPALESVSTKV
jgi:hypothetical protein